MKSIFIALFILHAALAAPIQEDEEVQPVALPQIEDGNIELPVDDIKEIEDSDDEVSDEKKEAEAAFMRMMNYGMSMGGIPSWGHGYGGMMNPYMNQMMQYSPYGYDQGMSPYGMYNPMMDMMGGMGGMGGYNPMMDMMGGMGGMGGYNPMMDPMMMGGMGGMGGGMYNPMMDPMMMGGMGGYNPMMDMMGGMGGMGGYNPMMDPMMGGMGGGMYNPMMDPMMGGMGGMGGYNPMMDPSMMGYMAQQDDEYYEMKNADFPIDYTLPCSDHCGCEQLCKFNNFGLPCSCRCPPKCSAPGIVV